MIQTNGLSKRYDGTLALDSVDLNVPEGIRSIGLLGENGAGKTTLIKLLLGLIRPTAGSGRVLGFDILGEGLQVRRYVGYMPEHECLPPDLTAMDFVTRMGTLSGLPHRVAIRRASDVLYLVGLGEERLRSMGGFSSGMKQRVKLAQALVHDPKLVFLDEPTSGMDPTGRAEMLDLIEAISSSLKISIVLSSHLLLDIERLCESIVMLNAGRVITQGDLRSVISAQECVSIMALGEHVDRFIGEIKEKGLWVKRDGSEFLVELRGDQTYDIIMNEAARADVQIRRLEHRSSSLETLFIRTLGEAREPGAKSG
ncbi:MAG: ABC transporter ATP-binding protein [Candidatus Bipolaricaulia bacterium]